jgi:DNA repair protein RadC
MSLKNLPVDSRPRERLAQKGAAALSSIELIAILLGSGTKACSALELASKLLAHFTSLERLFEATLQELLEIKGIGFAKGVQLQAAFSLGKRLSPWKETETIDSPEKAYLAFSGEWAEEKTEVLSVLLRDTRRKLIHKEAVAKGTLNQVIMHPREVFCAAIRHRAHSVIVAHNHPSGDPTPSTSDFEITQILRSAGSVVGIPIVDHLILGRESYFSFWQKGLLKGKSEGY